MNAYLDGRPTRERSLARYVTFAIVILLGIGLLAVRLAYLQIARATEYAELSTGNRTVVQAIPSSRGLIYDRTGAVLVTNIPTYAVKVRPADLPFSARDAVVSRLSVLVGIDPATINATIDANPGSRFDLVRIARDVPLEIARLISEARLDLPGVEVEVEARREYAYGPLLSQILGYTGPVGPDEVVALRESGYLADDLLGKTGVEATYESDLRGTYGSVLVERDATGRRLQVLQTIKEATAGNSLTLTIDTHEQELAQKALEWGMKEAGLKRGVVIAMNPQTGEVVAMVSLPTYDDNDFARGISNADYAGLLADPDKPLINHAIECPLPAGLHVQARHRRWVAWRTTRSRRPRRSSRSRTSRSGRPSSTTGTGGAGVPAT